MNQGEIWLCESPMAKARPALVITRDTAVPVLQRITVVSITRTLRRGPTQLALGHEEGLRTACVANFDDIAVIDRSFLTYKIGDLGSRAHELCGALRSLADC
jgi:mRNA interferase MazF